MFYAKSTGGFYIREIHGDNIPVDAVEITAEQHAALLSGQQQGKRIAADENGYPVLQEPTQPGLGDIKAALAAGIDEHISGIYSKFTRFETEYTQRELAARDFVSAEYEGDAGLWVTSFADAAGMTARQAADKIIQQADGLRAALLQLGAIRMRKYEVLSAIDAIEAGAVHAEIIEQADVVASAIQ